MKFKDYLLNEDETFLTERVGDIMNALQDLIDNAEGMGARQLADASGTIVNQIRGVLHTHWSKEEAEMLPALQKVGVAIMKAVEEKDELPGILSSALSELSQAVEGKGPVNQLAAPEEQSEQPESSLAEPEGKKPENEEQPQQPPQQPPAAPPQGQVPPQNEMPQAPQAPGQQIAMPPQ